MHQQSQQIARLEQASPDTDIAAQLAKAREDLARREALITSMQTERDAPAGQDDQAGQDHQAAQDQAATQTEMQDLADRLEQANATIADNKARLNELQATAADAADLQARLQQADQDRTELQGQLSQQTERMGNLQATHTAEMAAVRDAAQAEQDRLTDLLAHQTARTAEAEPDAGAVPADVQRDLEAVMAQCRDLSATLEARDQQIADLSARVSMAAASDAALHAQLEELATERRRLQDEVQDSRQLITELEVRASDAIIPDLLDAPLAHPEQAADAAPAGLLSQRPAEVDDLKRIKGIGPVLERVLNENGIYQYRQLARFSPQDVEWINQAIDAFPGRIQRDGWVAQAQALHQEKYGEAHDQA